MRLMVKVSAKNFLGTYSPPLLWSKNNFPLLNNSFVNYFKSNHHKYYDWWCLRNHNMSLMLNSHTIPYQTIMQPYEQVLTSLPSKYNEPYTKPCHNRYQQLDAIHHLAFPCTVFYHKKTCHKYQFVITWQAPIIWNDIPLNVCNNLTVSNFKKNLRLYFSE